MSKVDTVKFEFEPGEVPIVIKALEEYMPESMDERAAVDWILDELRKVSAKET